MQERDDVRPRAEAAQKRECQNCAFWVRDWGIFCVNGWSNAHRKVGDCHLAPVPLRKAPHDFCGRFEDRDQQ